MDGGGQTGQAGALRHGHRAGAGGGRRPAPHQAPGRGPADARSARRRAQEAGPRRAPGSGSSSASGSRQAAGGAAEVPRITHIAGRRPDVLRPSCGPGAAGATVRRDEGGGRSTPTKEGRTTPHGTASAAGPARSRRPFRPPDPPVEPEDAPVHLRRTFRHLHHRPPEDPPPDPEGAGAAARASC